MRTAVNVRLKAVMARVVETAHLVRMSTGNADAMGGQLAIGAVTDDGRPVHMAISPDQIGQLAVTLRYHTPLTVGMPVFVAGWPGRYRVAEVNNWGAALNIGGHGRVFVKPDGHNEGPSAWVRRALVIPA